jgi:FtsP/CotA-like multicopper oxidase with cupredoxin domain
MSIRHWSFIAALCFMAGGAAGDGHFSVPSPPEVRSQHRVASFTLHAALDANGRDAFVYKEKSIAPVIRVSPGDTLKINYVNDLPVHSKESARSLRAWT